MTDNEKSGEKHETHQHKADCPSPDVWELMNVEHRDNGDGTVTVVIQERCYFCHAFAVRTEKHPKSHFPHLYRDEVK